jgi:5'-phosphate synthase pdxT subunit
VVGELIARGSRQAARLPGQALTSAVDVERPPSMLGPVVGVLALQGDVLEHVRMLSLAGSRAVAVRHPEQLDGLDGVVLPGGESTTIGKMLRRFGLLAPLHDRLAAGLPALGTCAGAILLGSEALHADGTPSDQPLLRVMDTVVRRNAFGRQVASFEGPLDIDGVPPPPLRAAFIRAPWFERIGEGVEALARVDTPAGAKVVVARQGPHLAAAFHPELTGDPRLHALFVQLVRARQR